MWHPKIVPFGTLVACAITLRRNQIAPATPDQPMVRHISSLDPGQSTQQLQLPSSPVPSQRQITRTSLLPQRPRNNSHIRQFIPTTNYYLQQLLHCSDNTPQISELHHSPLTLHTLSSTHLTSIWPHEDHQAREAATLALPSSSSFFWVFNDWSSK